MNQFWFWFHKLNKRNQNFVSLKLFEFKITSVAYLGGSLRVQTLPEMEFNDLFWGIFRKTYKIEICCIKFTKFLHGTEKSWLFEQKFGTIFSFSTPLTGIQAKGLLGLSVSSKVLIWIGLKGHNRTDLVFCVQTFFCALKKKNMDFSLLRNYQIFGEKISTILPISRFKNK